MHAHVVDEAERARQIARLRAMRRTRSQADATAALARLRRAADGSDNLVPYLADCARAYCSAGEMVATLRSSFGVFREPPYR